jgi:hypothetical protein
MSLGIGPRKSAFRALMEILYIINTIRSFVLVPQILATWASGTGSALIWNPFGMIARNASPSEFTNRWFETLPSPLPINSNPELRNDAAGRVIDPPDNDPSAQIEFAAPHLVNRVLPLPLSGSPLKAPIDSRELHQRHRS